MTRLRPKFRGLFLGLLSGCLAGLAATVFLVLLDFATRAREADPRWIYLLPVAGLGIGWAFQRAGKRSAAGSNLILEEIHNPNHTLPLRMAPLVLGGTLLTHLCGGSAGREGTAVQMSATLADQLSGWFRVTAQERRVLLVSGMGAGFAGALGTPLAGFLFGLEVVQLRRLQWFAGAECLVASFVAVGVTRLLHAPHTIFPSAELPVFGFHSALLLGALASGLLFGVAARAFVVLTHSVEHLLARWVPVLPLRPFLGGCLLLLFFALVGSGRYAGLGLTVIQESFHTPASWVDPLAKTFATAVTVGSGFKGGEFVPLVFIGTTLGSVFAFLLSLPLPLFAALGFAAVFGGAANTPIACAIMAAELFGWGILPYAALACGASYLASGYPGLYSAQRKR